MGDNAVFRIAYTTLDLLGTSFKFPHPTKCEIVTAAGHIINRDYAN